MNIALVLIAAGIVVGLIAAGPTGPRSSARSRRRRDRQLHRNPARATSLDVASMLGRELPTDVTTEVCRLAESREVPTDLLWTWAEQHSPTLLALALSAGYDRRDLALTKPAESTLDQESLEMLAELNGALVGSMVVHAVHPPAPAAHPYVFGSGVRPTWAA